MIYLDANATSQLRPEVREALCRELSSGVPSGNPSSIHKAGRRVRAELRRARKSLQLLLEAHQLRAEDARIIFTSGGTEACVSMLSGLLPSSIPASGNLVSSAIEHQAVLEPLKRYQQYGWELRLVYPEVDGRVPAKRFLDVVDEGTAAVVLMAANNVTGCVQDVARLASSLRKRNYRGLILCDAVQALGKCSMSFGELFREGVDALSFSAHKLGGPSGVGALVLNAVDSIQCTTFEPLFLGGPQEEHLRAGTENTLGIIGFGAAAETRAGEYRDFLDYQSSLREFFWRELFLRLPEAKRLTPEGEGTAAALCNTLAVLFPGVRGDDLVAALDMHGVMASVGSACSSGRQEASHVIRSMGFDGNSAREVVRFSFDWDADEQRLSEAALRISEVARRMPAESESCVQEVRG